MFISVREAGWVYPAAWGTGVSIMFISVRETVGVYPAVWSIGVSILNVHICPRGWWGVFGSLAEILFFFLDRYDLSHWHD